MNKPTFRGWMPSCVLLLLVAAALALVLGGCGGGGASSSAPATNAGGATVASSGGGTTAAGGNPAAASKGNLDACQLVTMGDASGALSEPVKLDQSTGPSARSECNYVSSNNVGSEVVFVLLSSGEREKDVFDLARKSYKDAQPLSGLGDDAFAIVLGAPVAQVHVLKGGRYLIVAVTNMNDPQRLEKAKALALKAAAHM